MKYYVYRHIRTDYNVPFYIGVGTIKIKGNKYERAYSKFSRNRYWKYIVNKTNYTVEIVAEFINKQDAFDLEIKLINFYGRKDLESGTLCNMTNGGDGCIDLSSEVRRKIGLKNKGQKRSLEQIAKLKGRKGYWTGKKGKDHNTSKEIIQYNLEGQELERFENAYRVKEKYGYDTSNICRCCNGKRKTAFGFIWRYC